MSSVRYVVKHPDGTDCPEYSYPVEGSCPLIGTGVHAAVPYVPSIVTTDDDILDHFIGPRDVPHLIETGELRRVIQLQE